MKWVLFVCLFVVLKEGVGWNLFQTKGNSGKLSMLSEVLYKLDISVPSAHQ